MKTWNKNKEMEAVYKETVCNFIYDNLTNPNSDGHYHRIFESLEIDSRGDYHFNVCKNDEIVVSFVVPNGNYDSKTYFYTDCINNKFFEHEAISCFSIYAKQYNEALNAGCLDVLYDCEICEYEFTYHVYVGSYRSLREEGEVVWDTDKELKMVTNEVEEKIYKRIARCLLNGIFESDSKVLLSREIIFGENESFIMGYIDAECFQFKIGNDLKPQVLESIFFSATGVYAFDYSFYYRGKYIEGKHTIFKGFRENFLNLTDLRVGDKQAGEYENFIINFNNFINND